METTIASLPDYLKAYVVTQDPDRYSPKDHAAWRYIMRQSRAYFKDHAVSIYLQGLEYTGITIDRIPLISAMDAKLKRLGWGAVPVCGFIPPAAFLDFQARRILPIAYDMRSAEHIAYTPAPDIVHEAAGHAPIIADRAYADYLTKYATMAQRAIFSQEDLDLYEAIRTLSDIKENPDSSPAMIAAAETGLARASKAVRYVSEANKVARMNWWTVEYGLLGSLTSPKIYGAGLLSSVGESQNCLSPRVIKKRLSLACVDTPYDITEPQPQLFVGDDVSHLVQVLEELEATLAYHKGGLYGLNEAAKARTVTTTRLDSGVEVSGVLEQFLTHGDRVDFVKYSGPVQISHDGQELPGQGTEHHPSGFSSPLGRLKSHSDRPLRDLSDGDLATHGLTQGQRGRLELTTGFVIEGRLQQVVRQMGHLILLKWTDAQVTRGAEVFFRPEWGDFDMVVGECVTSVYGGPSDQAAYNTRDAYNLGQASTSPARQSPFAPREKAAFAAYTEVRRWRQEALSTQVTILLDRAAETARNFPEEWLLRLEALELPSSVKAQLDAASTQRLNALKESLVEEARTKGPTSLWLVQQGLDLAHITD